MAGTIHQAGDVQPAWLLLFVWLHNLFARRWGATRQRVAMKAA